MRLFAAHRVACDFKLNSIGHDHWLSVCFGNGNVLQNASKSAQKRRNNRMRKCFTKTLNIAVQFSTSCAKGKTWSLVSMVVSDVEVRALLDDASAESNVLKADFAKLMYLPVCLDTLFNVAFDSPLITNNLHTFSTLVTCGFVKVTNIHYFLLSCQPTSLSLSRILSRLQSRNTDLMHALDSNQDS